VAREFSLAKEEKSALQKIEAFLQVNNIELCYTEDDDNYIDLIEDRIVVSRHQPSRKVIYTILHEIGHYFSDFHPDEESHAAQVIEEVLAWDTGKDVAYALRIDIDEDAWNSIMIASIAKYIEK